MCNSKLTEEVMPANEEAHTLKEAEWNRISKYHKKAIANYKAFVEFKKGLERTGSPYTDSGTKSFCLISIRGILS